MRSTGAAPSRRSGTDTRTEIGRVALDLFTRQGYEATSMREIADRLGIKKASLYYHFAGKDDIVQSLFDQRGREAEELLEWVDGQPQDDQLPRAAVLRWIDSFTAGKLRGIRFLTANPLLARTLETGGHRISSNLTTLVSKLAVLLPRQSPSDVLQLRMALLSINAAVESSAGHDFTDDEILAAARSHATTVLTALVEPNSTDKPSHTTG